MKQSHAQEKITIYIITVTFNMPDGLRKTLDSVNNIATLFNDYKLNLIIVNGNPFDKCNLLISNYPGLIYKYIAEEDNGIYDAMNKGISNLPNEGYAIFINSDDELLSIPSCLSENQYDVIFANVISHDKASNLKQTFRVAEKRSLNSANLLRPRIHHQGCFVKTSVLKKHQFDLSVGIRADVLLMGTLLKNYRSIFIDETVALITTGGKSDVYNVENLTSFFKVADKLRISKTATLLISSPEFFKYATKFLIGQKGILAIRRIKAFMYKNCFQKNGDKNP